MSPKKKQAKESEDIKELIERFKGLSARVTVLESENVLLKQELNKLKNDKVGVKADMRKIVQEAVHEESYVEKLKKGITTNPGQVVQCVSELQDRRFNLVFRGIEESSKNEAEERKAHDDTQIKKVADKAGLPKKFAQSILSARRLGRKEEGKNHRPLLVRLSSQDL